MSAALRVVHAPARTPYARKLTNDRIALVNGTAPRGGEAVPRDMSLTWLLAHRPFDWFDVLHLHHVEFDDPATLRSVLAECSRAGRRVVFTAHDVGPVFGDPGGYHRKLRTLVDARVPFVCLTETSRDELRRRFGTRVRTSVLPHGYVVPPDAVPAPRPGDPGVPRYFLFGSLRENRDIATVLYNWRFGRAQRDTSLSVLLRAPGPVNLRQERERWDLLGRTAAADPRLRVDVLPFPSDDDVVEAALGCDALILPYLWGSHSGQLELAFDLGLTPVASAVGHLREQYRRHAGVLDEPIWFDWSDGDEYAYGARFLAALDEAAARLRAGRRPRRAREFAEHRALEHEAVLAGHEEVYARRWT
ncbi:hypothetical protein ACH4F6_21700 [Streptomyces sp. NPDC017936]|uniref:hypothetical protein n=1 Tax=Streptomyces sp. NPDC017936 TaxID=3365016 RepID=UPI00379BC784